MCVLRVFILLPHPEHEMKAGIKARSSYSNRDIFCKDVTMRFFSVQFVSCFLSNLELHVKYNFHFGGNFYGMSVGIYYEESFKSKGEKKTS